MTRLLRYLKSVIVWLAEPRMAWLGLATTGVLTYVALRSTATEQQIRISGVFLQLLGTGSVAYGVRTTRQLFGAPTLAQQFLKWFSHRPRWPRTVIIGAGGTGVGLSSGSARLDLWHDVPLDASTEVKVAALIQNVQWLRERTRSIRDDLDKASHRHAEALASEQQVRAASDAKLDALLREAQAGGLHITVMGLVWFFVGTLFSSLSPEIYCWRH